MGAAVLGKVGDGCVCLDEVIVTYTGLCLLVYPQCGPTFSMNTNLPESLASAIGGGEGVGGWHICGPCLPHSRDSFYFLNCSLNGIVAPYIPASPSLTLPPPHLWCLPSLDASSVADPDPGSGAFFASGSGIRNRFFRIPDLGSRIPNPYFWVLIDIFLGKKSIILWKLAQIFFFSTSKLK